MSYYERSLETLERPLNRNPESAQTLRDVSVGLNRLGEFLAQRGQAGDAERALEHYTRSLETREALLKRNPNSAEAARDVSVSLNMLGEFLAQRSQEGDAERALGHFKRGIETREALLKRNPESTQAARDVSVSLNMLGDFLVRRGQAGDAEQALGYYKRDLEISEALLMRNPDSAEATRAVSVSLDSLGEFLAQRGHAADPEQALAYYARSLETREAFLRRTPNSAQGRARCVG